jgi:hypothetical protein
MELSGQLYALATLQRQKETQYQLGRRMGRGLSWSGQFEEEKKLLSMPQTELCFLRHPTHHPITIQIKLHWFFTIYTYCILNLLHECA